MLPWTFPLHLRTQPGAVELTLRNLSPEELLNHKCGTSYCQTTAHITAPTLLHVNDLCAVLTTNTLPLSSIQAIATTYTNRTTVRSVPNQLA